ncbi:phage putative head morphogenesis protein, SPP1 gp7 family [Photorhabdus khanii NC19]|uniref:Phage putative head morphogenesis protein, SPP1 gp7 family n=1 Tax=Photorhabdus khanii NC19 TaxID=1004151 RepID=W3VA06_9GAMM|nr:phage head morphogenesis protein [Photorhabdus khanii]ETS31955.1 phage putative head morphogenesis protein, SPP1 gp7 family [Photorhabdus khanii NC19]
MPQPVDLGIAAKLEPKLAVDYFRAKGYDISWNWQETEAASHARAFTVAKAAHMDILTTIRDEVDKALSQGTTERDFIKTLKPRLQEQGWWGKQIVVDSGGNAETVQLGSPARLATIYRTNLATAYQAGRYQQQLASTDTHPYWQYIAVMDKNTRKSHAAMNGRVFRFDDPIWNTLYPPNDWGCRCRVRALTAAQVKRMGLKVESSIGAVSTQLVETGVDKRTGEVYQSEVTTYRHGQQRMTTGAGWSNNAGQLAMGSDISIARKLIALQNRELRSQVIQSLNNAPVRQQAFAQWVGQVLTQRRPGNNIQPLGFMTEDIAVAVEERTGKPAARVLAISEKDLVHADSLKHQKKGVALTMAEYQSLPKTVANPSAVLWDRQNQNVLYIRSDDNSTIKTVVNAPWSVRKQPDALDVVINTYRVPLTELKKGVAGGNYELLKGTL